MAKRFRPVTAAAVFAGLVWCATALLAEDERPADGGSWISEDIDAAYARAKETGKPLLVAFR